MELIIEHKELLKKYVEASNLLLESDSLETEKLNFFLEGFIERLIEENGEHIEIYQKYDPEEIAAEIIYEVDAKVQQDLLVNYSIEGLKATYNINGQIAEKLMDIIQEEKNGR